MPEQVQQGNERAAAADQALAALTVVYEPYALQPVQVQQGLLRDATGAIVVTGEKNRGA